MEDRISIPTPEHVELDFELAGLGSRMLAQIIDWLLIFVISLGLVVLFLIAGVFTSFLTDTITTASTASWSMAVIVVFMFIVIWGYFVFFEGVNNGQTPGKKQAGIRVIRDNGLPIGWREAALRNLVRAADMFPPPGCIVGAVMISRSERAKRLGDLLAGTIVVREDFDIQARNNTARWEAAWVVRVESGRPRRSLVLAGQKIDAHQIQIIERFLEKREALTFTQRVAIAWRIASPFLNAMGENPGELALRPDRLEICERILSEIMDLANAGSNQQTVPMTEDTAETKRREWLAFDQTIGMLHKEGKRGLRSLHPERLTKVIESYKKLTCDLARARSIQKDSTLVRHLNDIAIRAHNILYGRIRTSEMQRGPHWTLRFPLAVRGHLVAVALSAAMLFGPAVISYFAVQLHPDLGYDLVSEGFLDFEPARPESLHNIPSIARPIAASAIMTNNIQVTLLAFGLGMTAGIGTAFMLIFNGVHLGAVAGWMTARGNSRALWGWIMPHGGTELMAIMLAGAAGFVLARAIIAPGEVRRSAALRVVATNALIIELGVMGMLIVAGLIEGFISPSSIGFNARIAVLVGSLIVWLAYLGCAVLLPANKAASRMSPSAGAPERPLMR